MINSDWLKTFCFVAKTKNFTLTAKNLFMTQSGVSQHISKLEEHLGLQLIIREAGQFELTPAGVSVLEYSQKLILDEKLLLENISNADPHQGICRISSPGGVGMLIYPWLLDMQQLWPELNIHFTYNPTQEVEQNIKDGKCDLGLITHQSNDSELLLEKISQEHLCLVLPKTAKFKTFNDLENLGFIDHPDAKIIAAKIFPQIFKNVAINVSNLKTSGYINSVNQICDPVARGFGYTVLHENIVCISPVFDQLKVIRPKKTLAQDINAVYKRNWPLHPRYREIIENLTAKFEQFHLNNQACYSMTSKNNLIVHGNTHILP